MMGNPRVNYDRKMLLAEVGKTSNPLPESANKIVNYLIKNGRQQAGLRSYKFFIDMHKASYIISLSNLFLDQTFF